MYLLIVIRWHCIIRFSRVHIRHNTAARNATDSHNFLTSVLLFDMQLTFNPLKTFLFCVSAQSSFTFEFSAHWQLQVVAHMSNQYLMVSCFLGETDTNVLVNCPAVGDAVGIAVAIANVFFLRV